jgi:hypothetical protein
MRKYSYESILRTVGRVLDLAEADRFTVRDTEDGLLLEAFDTNATPTVAVTLDISELAQLLDWAEKAQDERPDHSDHPRVSALDGEALRSLLARQQTSHPPTRQRELVGPR